MHDLVIVGAGPSGLSCAIEAQRLGLDYVVVEKGGIVDAIRRFPTDMTFFSTPELLELGGVPFTTPHVRPSRVEALQYYRRVVEHFGLRLRLHTRVAAIARRDAGGFAVRLEGGETVAARAVVVATGYFDHVNPLGVPGEDLPHVSHYYTEPWAWAGCRVLVIGGRNSAVEAALDLYRHGAKVRLVHRRDRLADSVKYWVRPDIENRLRDRAIVAHFETVVSAIRPGEVDLRHLPTDRAELVAADFVLALIGHRPDEALLRGAGVELYGNLIPAYDPGTMETNVPGLYIAGSVACGCETWNIFIENGRAHARPILAHIVANRG